METRHYKQVFLFRIATRGYYVTSFLALSWDSGDMIYISNNKMHRINR
jgi:hypothetical protein